MDTGQQTSHQAGPKPRVKRWSTKVRTGCRTCRARRVKCDEGRPTCRRCTAGGRECRGYEVSAPKSTRRKTLQPRAASIAEAGPTNLVALSPRPPGQIKGLDAQAFDYFRLKTAPALAGHFSANVWEGLVLQLSQRHPLVHQASVAVGSLLYFRGSGPGCLTASKPARVHHELALTSYGKAVAGLRSFIERKGQHVDEEVTLVVLVSCLLFVCFEMLQGDQSSVICKCTVTRSETSMTALVLRWTLANIRFSSLDQRHANILRAVQASAEPQSDHAARHLGQRFPRYHGQFGRCLCAIRCRFHHVREALDVPLYFMSVLFPRIDHQTHPQLLRVDERG